MGEEGQSAGITVVIADDQEVAREGIYQILATAPDIVIVGVKDGASAQALVAQLHPHVLLLDLVMPGPSPAEIAPWTHEYHPEIAVLVLTEHDRDYYLSRMIDAGVAGHMDKNGVTIQPI